jgi:hypothetical protein
VSEKTASQCNHFQNALDLAGEIMMQSDPVYQAERIAKHYVAHAVVARQILELVEMCRFRDESPATKDLIAMLVEQIKNNHAHELGIELKWEARKF